MAIPAGDYDSATISNPSSALTDFSLMIDLSDMSSDWWDDVDTSDGTRGRACKSDGTTELACDWIDFDNTGETGFLRVKFSGSLASSGTQTIRVYPPNTGNATVAASATYGADNAYDSDRVGYWPFDGTSDRTSNSVDLTAIGSPTAGTGKLGDSYGFDGNDAYTVSGDSISAQGISDGYSLSAWISADSGMSGDCQIICGDGTARLWQWRINSSGYLNLIRFNSSGGVIESVADSTDHRGDGWIHVAATFNSTDGTVLYVGGSSAATSSTTTANGNDTISFRIGQNARSGGSEFFDGSINQAIFDSTGRAAAWIAQEYSQTNDNSTFWGTWTWSGSGTAYSLTCDSGTYTETGTAADLLKGFAVDAASGSYTETGTAAGLYQGFAIDAEAGSYTETGTAAGLFQGFAVDIGTGAYTLTGQDATLQYGANISITAESGAFTETGTAAGLFQGFAIDADTGSLILTGSDANLQYGANTSITAESGTFSETGTDAGLYKGYAIDAGAGSIVFTGSDATLTFASARSINAEAGEYTATGTAADLLKTWDVSVDSGSFLETGTDAALNYGLAINAEAGTFTETGTDIDFIRSYLLDAEAGAIVYTGYDVTLTHAQAFIPVERLTINGDVTIRYSAGGYITQRKDITGEVTQRLTIGGTV